MNVCEPPMIIDYHAHLHQPGTEKWTEVQKFDRVVLMSGGPHDNAKLMKFCSDKNGKYIPFCRLDLDDIEADVREVRRLAAEGFRGVKFQPMTQRFLPHERRLYPLWAAIEELGLPITSHSGTVSFPGHVANFADPTGWGQVAADFPKLKIVIAHMGGDYNFQALVMAETHPNVYMDTAHLQYFCPRFLPPIEPIILIERALRFAGADKILFGSEGMTPHFIWNSVNVGMEDRKKIFWKNALRLLGEKEI